MVKHKREREREREMNFEKPGKTNILPATGGGLLHRDEELSKTSRKQKMDFVDLKPME